MFRDNVVALSSDCRVCLHIEPDYEMPVLPLLHIITLVAFMFELYCGIMLGKSRNFYEFFDTLLY